MDGYIEHTKSTTAELAGGKARAPLARAHYTRRVRIGLTAMSGLAFVVAALLDERPQLMLIGLAPLALIAVEAVWHLLKSIEDA